MEVHPQGSPPPQLTPGSELICSYYIHDGRVFIWWGVWKCTAKQRHTATCSVAVQRRPPSCKPSASSGSTKGRKDANFHHCWWECKLIQPLWKTVWRLLKKLGIKPPHDPAIPLLGIYPEDSKIEKDTGIPLFTAAPFTIATTWKQPRCPLKDEWIRKLWYIYQMEYYSAIKRNAFESVLMRWF